MYFIDLQELFFIIAAKFLFFIFSFNRFDKVAFGIVDIDLKRLFTANKNTISGRLIPGKNPREQIQ
jgi:hypothetical protein